jgi:streptogramin lyase
LVTFPAAGYWSISARLRGKWHPLGRVFVSHSHPLFETEDMVAHPDGSLLVTEGGTRDRVLRVNPATGRFTVLARLPARPHALAVAGDEVLVSDWDGLRSIPLAGGPQRLLLGFRVGAIAVGPSGQIYYGLGGELRRLDPGGGDVRVTAGVGVRAIAVLPGGDLLVTEPNRLLRIEPGSGAIDVVVEQFRDSPVGGLLPEPSGTTLVTQIGTNSVLRVAPNGSVTVAAYAGGIIGPCALARTPDRSVYVLSSGYTSDRNSNGSIRRLRADGSTTEIRLLPPDRY